MNRRAYPIPYTAAALLAVLTFADPPRADSGDLTPAPTTKPLPIQIMVAQTSRTPAPTSTATAKTSADNPVETRITALHAELHITPGQEDLWSHVAQVMRDNEETMEALHKTRSAQGKTMTGVEDLKSYAEIAGAHAEGLKKFIPVFEALYAGMSDEQKKNADTIFGSHEPMAKKKPKSRRQ